MHPSASRLQSFNHQGRTMNTMTPHGLRAAIAVIAIGACAAQSAMAANVSVSINQPGVYGRVDIGEPVPQAAWVNPQPVIVTQGTPAWQRQPIYLYVPPAHSANWARYCSRYNACAQPVVFVQDRWVRERYSQVRHEHYRGRPVMHGGRGRDQDHDGIRNSRDRDRDGDGVRNSRDRAPDNPYRR
jgi:hypothetical protein